MKLIIYSIIVLARAVTVTGFVATRFCGHKERVCGPRSRPGAPNCTAGASAILLGSQTLSFTAVAFEKLRCFCLFFFLFVFVFSFDY